jgi:hypothetical protein
MPVSLQLKIAALLYQNYGMPHKRLATDLEGLLPSIDFSWPWFDEWHANFIQSKKWPQHPPGWSWYEANAVMPTAADAVRSMPKPDLLALAILKNIDNPAKLKVTELRALLIEKVRRSDVVPILELLAEKSQAGITAKRAEAKRMLLVVSIMHCAFMFFRFEQVCDLISCTSGRTVSLDTSTSDPLAKKFAKTWVFDPRSTVNLPPFFPGDCTDLRAPR